MANVIVDIKDVNKIYGTNHVVKDLNLQVEEGEFLTLLGSSGCGKTTTLRMIAGFEEPTTGSIQVEGEPIEDKEPFERNVNTVFQSYALFPHKTIYDNVAYGLKMKKVPKKEIKERVTEMLEMVQLSGFEKRYPSQLSGGQKQRVAIARALANNPDILLCDEATSALDIENTEEIVELLREINEKTHITIVFITHEMDVAKKLFDRIAFMEDGKLKEVTDIYSAFANPKSDIAKSLVQRVLNVEVPEGLKAKTNEEILRLSYTGDDSYDPVISVASKNYDITMDIINGKVDYIRNKPFGMLIVILRGEDAERKKALEYISKNVYKLERLGGR